MSEAASAIVKVQFKDEVLRFRVGWPLDLHEVRSAITSSLESTSKYIILYHGTEGKLLELSDATASDFINRHSDPVKPIRLRAAVCRKITSQQQGMPAEPDCHESSGGNKPASCHGSLQAIGTDAEAHSPSLPSADAGAEPSQENLGASANDSEECTDGAAAVANSGREYAEAASLSSEPSPASLAEQLPGPSEHPTAQNLSGGAEFLGGCRQETVRPPASAPAATPPDTRGASTGISLPIAARTAAYAISDMFDSARDKLNEALAVQDGAKPSLPMQSQTELQLALRESQELQQAVERSAAESRTRLAKVLDLYQLRLRPVQADGNCQFRALAVQLYGDESHHAALRARVVQQLRQRPDRYEGYMYGTYENYLEEMTRDGHWGDNVTLQAASDLLNREIQVLTDQPGSSLLELKPEARSDACEGTPQQGALCLAFLTEVHYDAVVFEAA